MENEKSDFKEETTSIIKVEEMSLEEAQIAEQLYNSAGLDPVVDAGLKDYGKVLQREDKFINKVLGPRGSDIRGYGAAVAKRTAFAIYTLLNKQYGGKVGDLRSYIMALEEERDRANTRYDDLMGRVVGILGDEYKQLRTDSKEFMEKLTSVLGEDLKESKINHEALAESLADIDGLRSRIENLSEENKKLKEKHESQETALKKEHKEELTDLKSQIKAMDEEKGRLKEKHESQIAMLHKEHKEELDGLRSQIAELNTQVKGLGSEKTILEGNLAQSREDYAKLKAAITTLAGALPDAKIGETLGDELYNFLLKDSKVPHMVVEGVGKFIDFKKYLGVAVDRGAAEASKRITDILETAR